MLSFGFSVSFHYCLTFLGGSREERQKPGIDVSKRGVMMGTKKGGDVLFFAA